jgi:homoserine kinase
MGPCDSVTAEWWHEPGVSLLESGHAELPSEVERHTSGIAALAVLRMVRELDIKLPPRGIALRVHKGIPLSAGQGGSAASAVAGAVACNALLGSPLEAAAIMSACLEAEESVAGRHLDNIAPALLGGICLVRSTDPADVARLPVPSRLRVVIAQPNQRLRTAEARAVLPATLERGLALRQMANVAAIVSACYSEDLQLLGRSLDDQIAEPVRAPLIPSFAEAKRAAIEAGALGASISGAGPTAFALCDSDVCAQRVMNAVRSAYEQAGIEAQVRATRIDAHGTRTETEPASAR